MFKPENKTLIFASSELQKYWQKMTDESDCAIRITINKSEFDLDDSKKDDAYIIDIKNGEGIITASNERSALLAVYKLVQEMGVRFLYPTEEGELIPKRVKENWNSLLSQKASYRHRGICIEGAVSLEHVIEMIDWSAKIGFNSYFIQFSEAHTFFERWYKHEENPLVQAEEYNIESSKRYVDIIADEIKKRGMMLHSVGHGWTCEAVGFSSFGWYKTDDGEISEEISPYIAMVNGKRGFFDGIPLNTHLCYSNEIARALFINKVVDYTLKNDRIDYLHVWLADNFNNVCECPECLKNSLPDLYVLILNEIDKKLTEAGNKTRIVFLIYLELLWTPEHERLINKDRFTMMFAPIHRTYTNSYLKEGKAPSPDDCQRIVYNHNKVVFPKDINENLAFLYEWKKTFDGDSFLFDYHLMWNIYRDFAQMRLSKVIYQDITAIDDLHLNGLISCQVQRAFFPNAISMFIMGRTLFNKNERYEHLVEEYMSAAYGEEHIFVTDYLTMISQCFSQEYACGYLPVKNPAVAENYRKGITYIHNNLHKLKEVHNTFVAGARKNMFEVLIVFSELMKDIGGLMAQKAEGDSPEKLKADLDILKIKAWSFEAKYNQFFDTMCFMSNIRWIIEDVHND